MELFNYIIVKILFTLISISFLIYFIQLFDGFHKMKEYIFQLFSGKESVSVDELIEINNLTKMEEEFLKETTLIPKLMFLLNLPE